MGLLDSFRKMLSSQEEDDRAALARKVKAAPQDPQTRQKYAAVLLRHGDITDAIAELAKAAELYEKIGFATKAVAVLRQLLKQDPSNVEAHFNLVRLLAVEGLTGDAQREVEKIAARDQFPSEDEKAAYLRKICDTLPTSPLPGLLITDMLIAQSRFFEAVTEMERVAPLAIAGGMVPEGAERVRFLAALAAGDHERLQQVGFLWLRLGRIGDGLSILGHIAKETRTKGESGLADDMDRVIDAIRAGDHSLIAAVTFADAVRIMSAPPPSPRDSAQTGEATAPGSPSAAPHGETPEEKNIVRDAVGKLQEKINEEIGESDHETRYNLGIAYKEMGLLAEAAEEFRVSRKSPQLYIGASALLAETLAEKGEVEAALEVLDEMIGQGVGEGVRLRDIRYQKGLLLEKVGRPGEAMEVFLSLHSEAPDYRDVEARTKGRRQ